MRLEEAGIEGRLLENLKRAGIERLYPYQVEALRSGLLEGRNLVVSAPTASGKTLLATIAAHRHMERGRKVLYLTPLRALTSEKYSEFKDAFSSEYEGFKIAAASSDYDDPGRWLGQMDMIVATYEKADSLIRHNASWIPEVGLLVVDEVHMLGDKERGPTLEMTIAKFLEVNSEAQVLCLSATVKNVEEIAEWLGAEAIKSDFRPVPLIEGVFRGGELHLSDGTSKNIKPVTDPLSALVLDGIEEGGQVLVFALTRRRAEHYASKLAEGNLIANRLPGEVSTKLREYAEAVKEAEQESPFSERLGSLMIRGVAFHHAGLGSAHRRLIEEAFRERALPILCATPTLAAGVNLPARTVIIPELRRYDAKLGPRALSVMEYKQLCGRAGRPRYDEVGYAVIIAKTSEEEEVFMERYVRGIPEKVSSNLGSERHLRAHTLSLIASGLAKSEEELRRFMKRTLYSHQFGVRAVEGRIWNVLEFLAEHGMIIVDKGIEATRLGSRVSELYIDPLSAVIILENAARTEDLEAVGMLQIVCMTPDLSELRVSKVRRSVIERQLQGILEKLPVKVSEKEDDLEGYESFIDLMRNVLVLNEWINETPEREIYINFSVEPGDFAILRERAEWISYAASQLLKVVNKRRQADLFRELTERVKHGVKGELLQLVSLPDIGRVRGRNLWNSGYRSLSDIAAASLDELSSVQGIGRKIAEKIKRSVKD